MTDPDFYITMAAAGLVGLGMTTAAALAGWRGWLQLKNREYDRAHNLPFTSPANAGARIEMADLKERIRKLEAIAAGVDL